MCDINPGGAVDGARQRQWQALPRQRPPRLTFSPAAAVGAGVASATGLHTAEEPGTEHEAAAGPAGGAAAAELDLAVEPADTGVSLSSFLSSELDTAGNPPRQVILAPQEPAGDERQG